MLPLLLLLFANAIRTAAPDAPARQPQLDAAHRTVALTFGAGKSIFFTSSSDDGRTFATPVKVAETGALALGRHRGPRVAILRDAILISAIAGEKAATGAHAHGLPEAGNLTVWRSTDRGRTWSKTAVVNDVPGSAREGLHSMAAGPGGSQVAAWLDLRTPGMKLYGARSTDGGLTWSKNVQVYASPDGEICSCCHPSLAVEPNGRIWAMWRNALGGNRDLYVARSDDGVRFEDVTKQGTGSWKLDACPMDGGDFVVHDGKVTSAWRREGDIYLAEAGRPERRLGAGKDVAMTRTSRGLYVAWTHDGGIVGMSPDSREPRRIGSNGGFPALVPLSGGAVLLAWEADGSIETARLEGIF